MAYQHFIDELPEAVRVARNAVEREYLACKRNQSNLPNYHAALAHWRELKYELELGAAAHRGAE